MESDLADKKEAEKQANPSQGGILKEEDSNQKSKQVLPEVAPDL
jgi:hypothetical protein